MGVKISAMPAATTPLAGTEELELVQGGSSTRVAAKDVANSADALPFLSLAGRAYGSFCDVTDQTGSTTAATAVKFGTNVITGHGVSMVTDGGGAATEITMAVAGTYAFAPNLQFKNTDAADHNVAVWLRHNGSDVANSATTVTVPKTGDGGAAFFQILFYHTVADGDDVQLMWLPSNVAVTIDYTAAVVGPPAVPAVPSTILSVERIA